MDMATLSPGTLTNEQEAYVRKHFRYNFTACLIDGFGWPLGSSFISASTILPLLVLKLTPSKFWVGLIAAIGSAGFFLPGIFIAHYIERLPILRKFVLGVALVERAPILLMGPLILLLADRPQVLLVVFFIGWTLHSVAMGFNSPSYFGLISKVIPARWRGRLYGISGALGGILGVVGAGITAQILRIYDFPMGFAICFLIAFAILTISVIPLGLVREPAMPSGKEKKTLPEYLRQMPHLLKSHPDFARYLLSQALYAMAGIAPTAFFTTFAREHLGATDAQGARFTAVLMAAGIVANPFWGYMGDHGGNRRVVLLGSLCSLLAPLLAIFAPSLGVFYGVFVLSAIGMAGVGLGHFNLVMEFAPPQEVATFIALSSLAVAPIRFFLPLIGGKAVDWTGYTPIFILSTAACLISAILLLRVREPREKAEMTGREGICPAELERNPKSIQR